MTDRLSTKQLMMMQQDQILQICGSDFCVKKCPFKKKLHKYREDGCCIKETYENADKWINNDEGEIKRLQVEIKFIKDRIKRYKKLQKAINKEIEVEE